MVYSVVTSWLYPTESGRDICSWDFETKKEAVAAAEQLCREEKENFEKVTGCDALDPETVLEFNDFFIITPKNGLDEWYFSAEAVELKGLKLRSTKKECEELEAIYKKIEAYGQKNKARLENQGVKQDSLLDDVVDGVERKERTKTENGQNSISK